MNTADLLPVPYFEYIFSAQKSLKAALAHCRKLKLKPIYTTNIINELISVTKRESEIYNTFIRIAYDADGIHTTLFIQTDA